MRFPYLKFGLFYKPVIPVTFIYKNKQLIYRALIDSGADINIIHAEIGDYLGINVFSGSKHQIGGISGEATGYIHNISLQIGGWKFNNIPVSFSYDISPYGFGVFGQKGFFDKFKIVFEYQKKQIELITKSKK